MVVTLIPLLLVLAGGSTDALDYLPTNFYWQAKSVTPSRQVLLADLQADGGGDISELIKDLSAEEFSKREAASQKILAKGPAAIAQVKEAVKSDDPEISSRAKVILEQLTTRATAQKIRRLMAIRTLGEMKEQGALEALKRLFDSKEPFVAEYAKHAVAAIEEKPYTPPSVEVFAEDVWHLPANCGLVGQIRTSGQRVINLREFFGNMPMVLKMFDFEDHDVTGQVHQRLLSALEMTGNLRFDSATIGIAREFVDGVAKFIVIEARGQFDQTCVNDALKTIDTARTRKDGRTVFDIDGGGQVLFLSDNRVLIVMGKGNENLPIDEFFEACESDKGKIKDDAPMCKLIETADRKNPLWMVMTPNETQQQQPVLMAFKSLVLTGQRQEKGFSFEIKGQGDNPAKVKKAADDCKLYVEMGKGGLKSFGELMGITNAGMDFLNSIKMETQENQALLKATLNDEGVFSGILKDVKPAERQPAPPPPNVDDEGGRKNNDLERGDGDNRARPERLKARD